MSKLSGVIAHAAVTLVLSHGPALPAAAHEIPSDVAIQVIARPQLDTLELLVRVPLEAMQDIEFPVTGPGYLDIGNAEPSLRHAASVWLADNITVFADGRALPRPQLVGVRVSLPSDRSFASYESAAAHLLAPPLPAGTQIVWQQSLLDAAFAVPLDASGSNLAIEPRFERLGLQVATTIRFVTSAGAVRVLAFDGDPGRVELDPRWHRAFGQFLRLGFVHILEGSDHLLFLLCLVLPMYARTYALIWAVTAFTLAHSVTLAASAFGFAPQALWFPPLIETMIAASILYMAIENAIAERPRLRSAMAFGFGLVHGFGFSFALRNTLQLAGDHVVTALAAFNVGVELGQLAAIVVMIAVIKLMFKVSQRERAVVLLICVLVGHTAWHWLAERYAVLSAYEVPFALVRDADAIGDPARLAQSTPLAGPVSGEEREPAPDVRAV